MLEDQSEKPNPCDWHGPNPEPPRLSHGHDTHFERCAGCGIWFAWNKVVG